MFQNTTTLFSFLWLKDKCFVIEHFLKIVLKYCLVLVNQVSVFCLISWAKCCHTPSDYEHDIAHNFPSIWWSFYSSSQTPSALGVQLYTIKRYINASFIHSFNNIFIKKSLWIRKAITYNIHSILSSCHSHCMLCMCCTLFVPFCFICLFIRIWKIITILWSLILVLENEKNSTWKSWNFILQFLYEPWYW